jgi:glycosyltransferase involved in cell wall biosynthesis
VSSSAGKSAGADVLVIAEQLRRRVPGGIGTYVRGLLTGLAELESSTRPSIGVVATHVEGDDPLDAYGFEKRVVHVPPRLVASYWSHGLGRLRGGRLVHATSFALPPTSARVVMTVHDLAFLRHPDAYPRRGLRWHTDALHAAIDRASAFVVPSESVRADLVASGADPARVRVIPEGADHLPAPDTSRTKELLRRVGVEGPFLLSVGTLEPRKNLARVIDAYGKARSSFTDRLPLLVVGPQGWGSRVGVDTSGVVFLGSVANGELAGLYAAATLLCYVPLEEGFGLPVVEAMQAGTPVLSSDVPAAGGASILVDPFDVDAIAAGIVTGVMDSARRTEAIAAGALRASTLTWSDVAAQHVAFWRGLLEDAS